MVDLKEKNKNGVSEYAVEIRPDIRVDDLFHLIIDRITVELGCPRAVIMLEDPKTGDFTIAAHCGISSDFAKSCRKSPNWTLGKVLWEEISTVFHFDNQSCKEYSEIRLEHDFISAICAPITFRNVTLGYIHCEHDSYRFDEEALRFVSSMARLCACCDDFERWLLYNEG